MQVSTQQVQRSSFTPNGNNNIIVSSQNIPCDLDKSLIHGSLHANTVSRSS